MEIIEKANEIINKADLKERHSFFQLNNFIIGKEPTLQSKLWQCVREINSRLDTVESFKEEITSAEENYEILLLKIKRIEYLIERESSDYKKKIYEIKFKKMKRNYEKKDLVLKKLNSKLISITEELDYFVRTFIEIEKIEKIKKYDDINSQNEYWSAKLGNDLNLRFLLNLPTDIELCKTILALPDSSVVKKQLTNALDQIQNNVLNNQSKEINKLMK